MQYFSFVSLAIGFEIVFIAVIVKFGVTCHRKQKNKREEYMPKNI